MTAQQIETKFKTLPENSMIRISNHNIYIVNSGGYRGVQLWDSSGHKAIGRTEKHREDLYLSIDKDRTLILLTEDKLEHQFNLFIESIKKQLDWHGNHFEVFKNAFDTWQY